MPTDKPDSTSYHPVEDGPEEPCSTVAASLPSAPPSPSKVLVCLGKSPPSGAESRNCHTTLGHAAGREPSKTRAETAASDHRGCITRLRHKPSERPLPPSRRSAPSSRRQQSGLIVRGRVFYVRLRVPKSLVATVGRTHVTQSLRTSNWAEAVRAARVIAGDLERWFSSMGVRPVQPVQPGGVPATVRSVAPSGIASKTLEELFDLFLSDPAKQRSRKTDMHYENLREIVFELWGAHRPLSSIDREACRDLLEVLRWLPSNRAKRFPKLGVMQAARLAKEKGLHSAISAATVNGYMTKLRTLFNFAVNEGWLDRSPARGLRVVDPVRRRDKRLPFSPEQLRLIFDAPLYRGCADDWFGYATPGRAHPRRGRFWVPLLALFAGLRLNEACQLDVADIQCIDGIDCIVVTAGSDPESEKRLKTASSERAIPVHPELKRIGFMGFVNEQRARCERKLFPELQVSSTGYYSDPFSKWFRRFLSKTGAEQAKTCFHSFRHSYRDALREARIPHEVALALGGWTTSGGDAGEAAAAYGRGHSIATLADALGRVSYPALDLSHLWA